LQPSAKDMLNSEHADQDLKEVKEETELLADLLNYQLRSEFATIKAPIHDFFHYRRLTADHATTGLSWPKRK
jgi:hypothetical protein